MFEKELAILTDLPTARVAIGKTQPLGNGAYKALFVDGGNAPVFDSAMARVEFIRVAGVVFDTERKHIEREEGFVTIIVKDDSIVVNGLVEFSVSLQEAELRSGKEEVSLAKVAGLARYILECTLGTTWAKKHACDLVVRDGTLEATNSYEEKALQSFSGLHVCGVAKTNTLGTLIQEGTWVVPVKENAYLARLHGASKYVFRLDSENAADVAGYLSRLSTDPQFLGYPYPLVFVDQLARVSNNEISTMRTRLMVEAGDKWKKLELLANTQNTHGKLDQV